MERKLEREERLRRMNQVEYLAEQKRLDELKRKRSDHPKVHHPVGRVIKCQHTVFSLTLSLIVS